MRCPACGLHHPSQYESCVSCGAAFLKGPAAAAPTTKETTSSPVSSPASNPASGSVPQERASAQPNNIAQIARQSIDGEEKPSAADNSGTMHTYSYSSREQESVQAHSANNSPGYAQGHVRRRHAKEKLHHSGLPIAMGVAVAVVILLLSAGVTIYFLTRPTDDQRLYNEGRQQLESGQYAFALKTLLKAQSATPNNPQVLLALARCYVGVDQIDKAWDCINQAQQLGLAVVSEPQLASDMANYYRQHQQYERALELMRPLAQANIAGKKAELADLDALWGDQALSNNDLEVALKCWEEVRELKDGSRFAEVDARLTTIYQKMATQALALHDEDTALTYLNRLNAMAPNAICYKQASEIYEHKGQLDYAIDQLKHAMDLGANGEAMQSKYATLLDRRGKELIDQGDTSAGYGYLQQAESLDKSLTKAKVVLRNGKVVLDPASGIASLSGEIWNPGSNTISYLTMRTELWDPLASRVLWQHEQKVVDEFMPPLAENESRTINLSAGVALKKDTVAQLRVYFDGDLYKAYQVNPLLQASQGGFRAKTNATRLASPQSQPGNSSQPVQQPAMPEAGKSTAPVAKTPGAEDKTLKELDF